MTHEAGGTAGQPGTVRRLFEDRQDHQAPAPVRSRADEGTPLQCDPRLGRGVRWSDIVAEIEREQAERIADPGERAA